MVCECGHSFNMRIWDRSDRQVQQAYQFIGMDAQIPDEVPMPFDFSIIKQNPMVLKLDVGASSYYSEIASIQTLDNLLRMGQIDVLQYLERIPDGYIPARRELIEDIKNQRQAQMAAQMQQMQPPADGSEEVSATQPELPTGGGYSALQRKVNETGTTEGLV